MLGEAAQGVGHNIGQGGFLSAPALVEGLLGRNGLQWGTEENVIADAMVDNLLQWGIP